MSDLQHLAEATSLALTVPTLITAAMVLYVWGPSAMRGLKEWPDLTSNHWLILGVALGFVGSFLDNLYWAIPWTASFFDLDVAPTLVDAGVFFNVFSRQGLGIAAAYCHLRAGAETPDSSVTKRLLCRTLALSYFGAVVGATLLWGLKM